MPNIVTKGVMPATLAATALATTATPAVARHYDRGNGDDAAIAIGAGIVGLAIGAIVAGSNKRDRYDRRYHVRDGWYYDNGYYYNRSGQRYTRDAWQRRYGDRYDRRYRDRYGNDYRYDYRGDYRGDYRSRDYYNRRGYNDGYNGRYGY